MPNRRAFNVFAVVLLNLFSGQLELNAQDQATDRTGKKVYDYFCYQCHSYAGDGNTLAATYLTPKPRDFTRSSPEEISRERMVQSVTHGREGTAMVSFSNVMTEKEIEAVVNYIRQNFMVEAPYQGRYHTAENGWDNHERYLPAFPFATGEIALDTPWESLNDEQQRGKRLFLTSCISCHDVARVANPGPAWSLQAISYPRANRYIPNPSEADALTGASVFMSHDIPPKISDLSKQEKKGEQIYQQNCAFCHAADGTGRNWIGQFMQPPARDLTQPHITAGLSQQQLALIIREGLPDTSMPAWKEILDEQQIEDLIAYIKRAFSRTHTDTSPNN